MTARSRFVFLPFASQPFQRSRLGLPRSLRVARRVSPLFSGGEKATKTKQRGSRPTAPPRAARVGHLFRPCILRVQPSARGLCSRRDHGFQTLGTSAATIGTGCEPLAVEEREIAARGRRHCTLPPKIAGLFKSCRTSLLIRCARRYRRLRPLHGPTR